MSTPVYRLVRNLPIERYRTGRPQQFAPFYDVEEIDAWRMPVRVLAVGLPAEKARDLIARKGIEDRSL